MTQILVGSGNLLRRLLLAINAPPTNSLGGYSQGEFWRRRLWLWALLYLAVLLGAAALIVYMGSSALMGLAAPLGVLVLLIVWAFPDSNNPPLHWISGLLFGFVIALLFWPDYLAFDLPGLPWLTALRFFSVPLALALLISISVSADFRKDMRDRLSVAPVTHTLLLSFIAIAAVSVLLSSQPSASLNKLFVASLYWFLTFYAAVWVFSRDNAAMRLAYFIWFFAVFTSLIGLQEWRLQAIPWAGSIPSFLAIDDPVIQNILSAKSRAATGIYRVQSKFTTPLGFAEYLAFSTPFAIYFLMFGKNWLIRLAALGTLPLLCLSILRTDSRLGFVGFFMSFLLFMILWALRRWRQRKDSIFGPAIAVAYPIILCTFLVATFFVGRLRALIWGTKAQSFSSMAREEQVDMGLPMIWSQPWGRGIGRAAEELGYRNLEGGLTIDSYYLAIALEFGVIGFVVYFGIFLTALLYGMKYLLDAKDGAETLLIPVMIAISIFVVVKLVLAQQENHPLVFILLGALFALCYRTQTKKSADAIQ